MADAMFALNDNFFYNVKIARSLQQFLTINERKVIQFWLDRLLHMNTSVNEMIIRSDYMWFILLMLQSKKLREPFTKLPPPELLPLKKFIPVEVYEEVLISNEPNMIYVSKTASDDILALKEKRVFGTSCSSLRSNE